MKFQDGDVVSIALTPGDDNWVIDVVGEHESILGAPDALNEYIERGWVRYLTMPELKEKMDAVKAHIEELEDEWYWLQSLIPQVEEQNRRTNEHRESS